MSWPPNPASARRNRLIANGFLIVLVGVPLLFAIVAIIYNTSEWNRGCEAKGGYVESGRGITLCIKDGRIVETR